MKWGDNPWHNWRDDPITNAQRRLILEMHEFSDFPLPAFHGTTKGEAVDYIDANLHRAHHSFDFNSHSDNYGDRI